jgi:succinate dehydrogenase flavin-adding protein (antitoxin of CptAB toxin-antitoxin module)
VEITEDMIYEINNEIKDSFEAIYQKYLQPKKKMEFERYFHSITEDTWEELRNLMEVTKETVYAIVKKREVTKRRWVQNEYKEDKLTGFQQEVAMFSYLYDKYKDTDLSSFERITGARTVEEAEAKEKRALEEWEKNHEILVCDFPYFKFKKTNQIHSAIINDAKYLIIKKMKEKYPKGEQGTIVSMPNSITKFPYDHTNRVKINQLSIEDSQYYKEVYFINDKTRFESRLNVEALQEGLMQENLKLLNSSDHQILFYLMSLKHEALYQPIPMVVEIGEIVRNVYLTDGKKNYLTVKESLIKMDYMEVRVIDESTLRSTKVEIFHKVTIEVDEVTKKEVARIIFSEDLIHEFVKNQTVSIYKQIIDRFKLNSTKVLIYPLQRQRIYSASIEQEGNRILYNTNLSFFRGALVFGSSKRGTQIKMIENALDEIIENKITLKWYERKGDNFLLEFYPFTEKEKRDLLSNNAPEKFLLNKSNPTKKITQ